jgi:hypothetical protein
MQFCLKHLSWRFSSWVILVFISSMWGVILGGHRRVTSSTGGYWCAWLSGGRIDRSVSFRVFGILASGSSRLLWVVIVFLGARVLMAVSA